MPTIEINTLMRDENTYRQLTAEGIAALAVIEITGPDVGAFLCKRFSRSVAIGKAVHGELNDDHGVIDDPLVVRLPDRAELHLHGGEAIVHGVCRLLETEGFAVAQDSPDAAIESRVLRALPKARTRLALQALLNQSKAWGVMTPDPGDNALRRLLDPPTVAIIGVPNAGKSSLANRLFERSRTIVADMPGTTRDYVSDEADIDGLIVRLLDTPGVRDTGDPIERRAIELARSLIDRSDLQILLIDATAEAGPQLATIQSGHANRLVVANKCDLARSRLAVDAQISAASGAGVDRLRQLVKTRLLGDRFLPTRAYEF